MKRTRQMSCLFMVIGMTLTAQNLIYANGIRTIPQSDSSTYIKALSVGDKIPDNLVLSNTFNSPTKTIRLADLKGKLVILDFWSTWCTACLASFPKMQKLQQEFEKQLQVLLVNSDPSDDEKKVANLFERLKTRTGQAVELPYSLQQIYLNDYFPHKYVPHYVWIDENGVIIAITSLEQVTHENIQKALKGNKIALPLKKDLMNFDREKPLLVNNNGAEDDHFLYRSIISKYIDGIGGCGGIKQDANGKIIKSYSINLPLLYLFQMAYPDKLNYTNRTVISIKEPASLQYSETDKINTLWCYELIVPPSTRQQVQEFMQTDLEKYFHIGVKTEKRKIKCLILKATGKIHTFSAKSDIDIENSSLKKYMHNQSISRVVQVLNGYLDMPLLDETNLNRNVDIEFTYGLSDRQSIVKALQQAGFIVTEEEREINIAVIYDK